ncbi:mitochondrial inner membrane protein [Pochonia chlamydosporia 170]|uniref:Sensitive to high expression protein 9, mitochondrial n=1 Tax=Pochonia chlamydosporia 170 TaxID=1380566 RepID=A0A179FUA0_METCM|nr:mitochondrial inner membrane protein [Pochonia chlamydosporia 170]OAQ68808.2 mitochondrial inner membrane protein [Pochonia chlamydosporia 170]
MEECPTTEPKFGPAPFLPEGGQEPVPGAPDYSPWIRGRKHEPPKGQWSQHRDFGILVVLSGSDRKQHSLDLRSTEAPAMQPFGGPMARAAWAGGRRILGRDVTAFAQQTRTRESLFAAKPVTGLQRCARHSPQSRSFSSQIPPKNTESSSILRNGADTKTQDSAQPAKDLPSVTDSRRSELNQKFSQAMDNLQARVLTASQTLNDITGYSSIEGIKKENDALEAQLAEAHATVRNVRQAYKTSNTKRATTQREVTTLLARKDTWSPADLERFTELYRTDHVLEGEVSSAQEALTEAEAEEQSLSQRLNAGILKRYHEEQIWSDRIRRASTWGTWGLMGMNFLLFVVLQFFAEPWRRRRLVKGVVEEEKKVLEEVRGELEAVKMSLTKKEEAVPVPVQHSPAAVPVEPETASSPLTEGTWKEFLADPARWQAAAADLVSERRIDLRMRDASTLAFQGAVTGAAVAGSIAVLLLRRT